MFSAMRRVGPFSVRQRTASGSAFTPGRKLKSKSSRCSPEPSTRGFPAPGITTGCSTTPMKFCPNANVTRQEMAVFIVRAFHIPLP